MSATLDAAAFDELYEAVHGHEPFPWQHDLVDHLLLHGQWPDVLDVPTGLGKTSVIDIAVFVAAATGCAPTSPGRRRTFFVIDRRIVVDEAFDHARQLADALRSTHDRGEALRSVASALASLRGGGSGPPLAVERMRGGVTWSWRWMDRPDQAAVVVGTVDQLGSRLLFGGYGIDHTKRPLDAALVGTDSLIVIDEAHLARPLIETISHLRGTSMTGVLDLPSPMLLRMSATSPTSQGSFTFPAETRDERDSETARIRLNAPKLLHAVAVPKRKQLAAVLADYAERLIVERSSPAAIAVVCNTVATARAVADELRRRGRGDEVSLLTGRIRGHDRDELVRRIRGSVHASRDRAAGAPTILVATQTIEVGANIDVDGLVTESAPLDALVQRLGRLNRLGIAPRPEPRCIVVHHEQEQPVYGEARERTWDWLSGLVEPVAASGRTSPDLGPGLVVSPSALRQLVSGIADVDELHVDASPVPVLFEEIVADWARTSDGDGLAGREPFLHGLREDSKEVTLVWRSDLPPDDPTAWGDLVDRLPPVPGEQLEIPLRRFQAWVRGDRVEAGVVSDVALAATTPEQDGDIPQESAIEALRWRGRGDNDLLTGSSWWRRVRPGDLLVLPATAGGCDREGWAPGSTAPVTDLAELAEPRSIVRIDPRTLPALLEVSDEVRAEGRPAEVRDALLRLAHELSDEGEEDLSDQLTAGLHNLADELGLEELRLLAGRKIVTWHRVELALEDSAASGVVMDVEAPEQTANHRRAILHDLSDGASGDTDPLASSATRRQVSLDDHHRAVEDRARQMAHALGLSDPLTAVVASAAANHDLGKTDPRFQIMLHAGDSAAAEVALRAGQPLAKSGLDPADRATAQRAFRASRLPRGYRHECGSAQAVRSVLGRRDDLDEDLLIHLVASHHGRGRPLLPPISDDGSDYVLPGGDAPVSPRRSVDFDHPARFDRLSERYGHWGLALLETIVRLADIGCSEEGT